MNSLSRPLWSLLCKSYAPPVVVALASTITPSSRLSETTANVDYSSRLTGGTDPESGDSKMAVEEKIDIARHRFPFCIVWTPLPVLTWIFPLIGHLGIATSKGIIRDFSGSYCVTEDDMGFDWPTMYWQLSADAVEGGAEAYDRAIREASDEYKGRMHNLCCDNCHSHVALALNTMRYGGHDRWNMVKLGFYIQVYGKFTGFGGFLKQWGFFIIMCFVFIVLAVVV